MPVQDGVGYARAHPGDDPVAQCRLPWGLESAALARDSHRHSEADDARHVLRSGAPALLLAAAGLHRRDARPAAYVQRADALRPVELMGVDREEVDRDRPHVDLESSD